MFFISPPFGNYLSLPKTTSIYGSYTVEPRPGLWPQIFRTLRYSFRYKAWVNQIGLRNKGIHWALQHVPKDQILSIAIMHDSDIPKFLETIPDDRNLEINISCPNVQKTAQNNRLGEFVNNKRKWCIVKLSPKVNTDQIDGLYKQGFRQFHCSNTIPVPEGGLSGPMIRSYSDKHITYIRTNYPDSEIIGGGGITNWNHVESIRRIGADHFSISSGFFQPWKLVPFLYRYYFFSHY